MTHIKPTHVNKLSLWLNCSTGRDRAGTGRRGAYGQALGTNARLVIFPSLPPLLFFFPHCDRCRVAKFIPNLIAVRQWTQCWIVYYFIYIYYFLVYNYVKNQAKCILKYFCGKFKMWLSRIFVTEKDILI